MSPITTAVWTFIVWRNRIAQMLEFLRLCNTLRNPPPISVWHQGPVAHASAAFYSTRSAVSGFTPAALRAGKYPASSPTPSSRMPTARNVTGSVAVRP
jgi:hypothetical protein